MEGGYSSETVHRKYFRFSADLAGIVDQQCPTRSAERIGRERKAEAGVVAGKSQFRHKLRERAVLIEHRNAAAVANKQVAAELSKTARSNCRVEESRTGRRGAKQCRVARRVVSRNL